MNVFKNRGKLAAGLFLFLALAGCGGGGNGSAGTTVVPPPPTETKQWQLDGLGNVEFYTNDTQYYGYGFWSYFNQSYQAQMTTVTATVEKMSGATNYGYGINFCYQDDNNFYYLLVDALGHYTVRKKVAGTYSSILDWTAPQTATINSGLGVQNEISVTETSPNNFQIFFNGIQETQFSDSAFVGGKAGFHVSVGTSGAEQFPYTAEDVRLRMTAPIVYPASTTSKPVSAPESAAATGAGNADEARP